MPKKFGPVSLEIRDALLAGASAEQIDELISRYLPDVFKNPLNYCSERENGLVKIIEVFSTTSSMENINLYPSRKAPEWADRFQVKMHCRIRFKPKDDGSAIMLLSITVEVAAEKEGEPKKHEDFISRLFSDFDASLTFVEALVP